jgi:ZIP family zinc transporter
LIGFLLGAVFLRVMDQVLPHMHPDMRTVEGVDTAWRRTTLLVLAITLHNIPEGLAVGVAFGAAAQGTGALGAAVALAIGIGLQNFPEGSAVSLPLRREGMSRRRALWYGQLSGIVEPVAGVLGAWLVIRVTALLPYALAFAAGAMIFVVAEELIPESQREGNVHHATGGMIVGFPVMMALDVALG